MDIGQLVGFLAPYLGPLLEGAGTATVNAAGGAWEFASRIWDRIAGRVSERPAAQEAARDVAESPDSEGARAALAWQLEKLLSGDPALMDELAALVREASAAGVVITNVTASGERSVAIGGNVSGGHISTGDSFSRQPNSE
ncbi:hypothetical protein AB1484_29795 [Parafrankia sp. FMc6]|uniref:hypothetical protein n=1 Tax=Parafrankia soli TaxID=2599596 RepID=UPI0034D61A2A